MEETKPDLILLDIMMSEMSGYEVCQKTKKDPHRQDIPIILMTAKAGEEDWERGKRVGADGFIAKPYEFSELINKIRTFIKD